LRKTGFVRRLNQTSIAYLSLALIGLLGSVPAAGLQAIVEVNEDPWYTDHKNSRYNNTVLTAFYAPLPVFFEGWKSTPRESIVDHRWDFGDGSPIFHGFNAAHVYEQPGTYTAKLTVDDGIRTRSSTITIHVWERSATTYYVDAQLGSDANDGLSPGAGAWRTATHAFKGMESKKYKPGDQILFKRGQIFDVQGGQVRPGHNKSGYGYMFGAHGDPHLPKPVLQNTGGDGAVLSLTGNGLAHFAMVDLVFKMEDSRGERPGEILFSTQDIHHILFLRCEVRNFTRAITFSQGITDNRGSGVFLVGCDFFDSEKSQIFMRVTRLALLDNTFDYSGNHIAYLNYVNKGVVSRNVFSRPAFGRAGLRLDGDSGFPNPTNNVVISDNRMEGWKDPRSGDDTSSNGNRFNWNLVSLAPNGPWNQRMHDVVFERNIVTNAEQLLMIADYDNLTVRNNIFASRDHSSGPSIRIGYQAWEEKPIRNLDFIGNTVVVNGSSSGIGTVIQISPYVGDPFDGVDRHKNIRILNNIIFVRDDKRRIIRLTSDAPSLVNEITADHNVYYAANSDDFSILRAGEQKFDLAGWRAFTGQDSHTVFAQPQLANILGPDGVFSGDIFNANFRLRDNSPALGNGISDPALGFDFDGNPRPTVGGISSGAFEQSDFFTVQVEGDGYVTTNPQSGISQGQVVSMTAVARVGWRFDSWSGSITHTANPITFQASGPMYIVATFVEDDGDPIDVNRSGRIDIIDLQLVVNVILGGDPPAGSFPDVNGDGTTNIVDLNIVSAALLESF
jgi:PKD repeat protein